MEPRLAELEQRLARAERCSRLLFGLVLITAGGAVTLGITRPAATQTEGTTLKAPLKVVDPQGRRLLEVGQNHREVYLHLFNQAGEVSAELISGEDSVNLYLNRNGTVKAGTTVLSAHRAGGRLDFVSPRRKQQVVLQEWDDDKDLTFYNQDQPIVPQASLRVFREHKSLTFTTATENRIMRQVSLTAAGRANKKLTFYDAEGQPAQQLP
jgi:hypothetical protein